MSSTLRLWWRGEELGVATLTGNLYYLSFIIYIFFFDTSLPRELKYPTKVTTDSERIQRSIDDEEEEEREQRPVGRSSGCVCD